MCCRTYSRVGDTDLTCLTYIRKKFPNLRVLKLHGLTVDLSQFRLLRTCSDILTVLVCESRAPIGLILKHCHNLRHLVVKYRATNSSDKLDVGDRDDDDDEGAPSAKRSRTDATEFANNLRTFDFKGNSLDEAVLRSVLLRCHSLEYFLVRCSSVTPELDVASFKDGLLKNPDALKAVKEVRLYKLVSLIACYMLHFSRHVNIRCYRWVSWRLASWKPSSNALCSASNPPRCPCPTTTGCSPRGWRTWVTLFVGLRGSTQNVLI